MADRQVPRTGTDISATEAGGVQEVAIWEATAQLRFREHSCERRTGILPILEQAWVDRLSNNIEWRRVETVCQCYCQPD